MTASLEFLRRSVRYLPGVGPARADTLEAAGIQCSHDLLHYYPRRHLDRSEITPIRQLKAGSEPVTVVGTVRRCGLVPRGKRRFELTLTDHSGGSIRCVWFKRTGWIARLFKAGDRIAVHGRLQQYRGALSMTHPDFDKLDEEGPALDTGRIIALYPGSASLASAGLTSRSFRRILYALFKEHGLEIPETLPRWVRERHGLMEYRVALRAIHFPKSTEELRAARRRLIFEELFFIQLMLARLRSDLKEQPGARLDATGERMPRFLNDSLPFELTAGQEQAIERILRDTRSGHRMNRLLQGDVGSGKTVVAVAALLHAVDNGYQTAFLAPTEILAEQHYRNLGAMLDPLMVRTTLLTGGLPAARRRDVLSQIAGGTADIVVGTHAIIQDGVEFARLGLAVIDEQHRFGVLQRAELSAKGFEPHILLMTATPIPRSLAMTVYGDLDVTVMRDRPAGRQPVETRLMFEKDRDSMHRFLRGEVEAGRQAYVVYPLVSESEKVDLKDAETGFETLSRAFPDTVIRLLHGRMTSAEKDQAMQAFMSGEVGILVSTTVIEVGVDVPNATVMVVEHAERFGLSQLHQLRGRVGRGSERSHCILMATHKQTEEGRARLEAMVETDDGFKISEIDLKLRGAGDFFGTRQSGIADLKIADLARDVDVLAEARDTATDLVNRDTELALDDHQALRAYFTTFCDRKGIGLARVG